MTITDIYRLLFGRKGIQDGNVIDMAEHGRVGGVSTGQGYKNVALVDTGKTLLTASGSVSSSGDNTIVTATAGSKIKVYAYSLSTPSTTDLVCAFQSDTAGTELWRVDFRAPATVNTGANLAINPPAHIFATAAGKLLNLNLGSAQTVHYSVAYFVEA